MQFVPGRQHASAAAGGLRIRGAPRVRVGLPRIVLAVPVQLVPGQVHPVRSLRPVLLTQQVHIPLAPHRRRITLRAAGRGQLQLVAPSHEAQRRPAGSRGARVGGRQGHVQRWHAKTGRAVQAVTNGLFVAAPCTTTAATVAAETGGGHDARHVVVVVTDITAATSVGSHANASASDRAPSSSPQQVAGAAKEATAAGAGSVHAAASGHGRLRAVATAGQPVRRGRRRSGRLLRGRRFALLAAQTRSCPAPSQRVGQQECRR